MAGPRFGFKSGKKLPGPRVNFRLRSVRKIDTRFIQRDWRKINESPLKRAGLFVRKVMRQSIRKDTTKKQRPSKPGRPPKSRAEGHPFRRIHSFVDRFETFAIIGHEAFRKVDQTVMEIHEFGQPVKIKVPARRRRRARSRRQAEAARRKFQKGEIKSKPIPMVEKTIQYPKREFAFPSLKKTEDKLNKFWRNSINKAGVRGRTGIRPS